MAFAAGARRNLTSLQITQKGRTGSTIGAARPVGICGTGILKAISEMLDAGLLRERGMLNRADVRVRALGRSAEFPLVSSRAKRSRREIVVTRKM